MSDVADVEAVLAMDCPEDVLIGTSPTHPNPPTHPPNPTQPNYKTQPTHPPTHPPTLHSPPPQTGGDEWPYGR